MPGGLLGRLAEQGLTGSCRLAWQEVLREVLKQKENSVRQKLGSAEREGEKQRRNEGDAVTSLALGWPERAGGHCSSGAGREAQLLVSDMGDSNVTG